MKKKFLFIILIAGLSGTARATESIVGDLFPYDNKHSSFTVDVDAGKLDRFSIEVVYSTGPVADAQVNTGTIDITNDTILVLSSHSFAMAQPVVFSTFPAFAPTPLTTGTTYFVVKISDSLLKLATTYAQAIVGDAIDITSVVGKSTQTWTLHAIPLNTGTANFSWLGSNDALNWVSVGSVGSSVIGSTQSLVSMGTASLSARLFDWGEFAYKYLRFTFAGPTYGVIRMRAYLSGKTRE